VIPRAGREEEASKSTGEPSASQKLRPHHLPTAYISAPDDACFCTRWASHGRGLRGCRGPTDAMQVFDFKPHGTMESYPCQATTFHVLVEAKTLQLCEIVLGKSACDGIRHTTPFRRSAWHAWRMGCQEIG